MEGSDQVLAILKEMPLPPSENHLYRNVPRLGRSKTRLYKDYELEFETWAWKCHKELTIARNLLSPHPFVGISLHFRFEYSRLFCKDGSVKKNDVTNRLKCFLDLLAKHLHFDDSRFFEVTARKTSSLKEGVDVAFYLLDFL